MGGSCLGAAASGAFAPSSSGLPPLQMQSPGLGTAAARLAVVPLNGAAAPGWPHQPAGALAGGGGFSQMGYPQGYPSYPSYPSYHPAALGAYPPQQWGGTAWGAGFG